MSASRPIALPELWTAAGTQSKSKSSAWSTGSVFQTVPIANTGNPISKRAFRFREQVRNTGTSRGDRLSSSGSFILWRLWSSESATGVKHANLHEIVRPDLFQYADIEAEHWPSVSATTREPPIGGSSEICRTELENPKSKHRAEDGRYPFVRLVQATGLSYRAGETFLRNCQLN